MKTLIGSLAIAVAFALPVVASGSGPAQGHAVKGKTIKAKTIKRPAAPRLRQVLPLSPYAYHHPSYDVYVNGEYAGSDPDPRIRRSLAREYCEQQVDGC
jgi:hypothetical protein